MNKWFEEQKRREAEDLCRDCAKPGRDINGRCYDCHDDRQRDFREEARLGII